MTRGDIHSILVIGSGPIVIGQAAEFDYAGTQACRSLREEGVRVILVNSNPATIMTDEGVADVTYIEPLTVEVVRRIIARERPDGLLATLGGQTGLNLAVALAEAGVLAEFNVRLLGTPLETIRTAEDRELFKQLLLRLDVPVLPSETVTTVAGAVAAARTIGLPAVVRPAFTLGGTGGGIARTEAELRHIADAGLLASPIGQVLIEQYLGGWKEIEYEVMRDSADTCITVCNMENFDPLGVHTGDSIVVAPSQTLSDREYQMLRSISLRIIRALGVEGGCNIQFALDPHSFSYYVIEVNPRVSRSSALASKATGYPIARVAAKIAIGRRLDEIANQVTGRTVAAFEPALDYCVVKIPRWPFDKFPLANRGLGTQMKATGEVMAIDRSFEAALQKAMRSLEVKAPTRAAAPEPGAAPDQLELPDLPYFPMDATDARLWHLLDAVRHDDSDTALGNLHAQTGIDHWFLAKLRVIVRLERRLAAEPLTPALLRQAKRAGFSDEQIAALTPRLPAEGGAGDAPPSAGALRRLRRVWRIRPTYKMVDTCAAEFAARTPYFYSTYEQENEAESLPGPKAVVLGSGPIRIGQGIEFDYCSVRASIALREAGVASVMLNSNPETVSTDFDMSDRLYFEPLDAESVLNVLENEAPPPTDDAEQDGQPAGRPPVIVQFGGQTAINLAQPLVSEGATLLGTSLDSIDLAEDRQRFDALLERLGIPRPRGGAVRTLAEALRVAGAIGYPVLVRPSYVLGGRAMEIVRTAEALERYVAQIITQFGEHPILIDRYVLGREVEVDALCDGTDVLIPGIMEHIERAGVHSGDSFAVYPPRTLTAAEIAAVARHTRALALALGVRGLMNAQFVIADPSGAESDQPEHPSPEANVYILEVNPRASRTVPVLSKVTGVPMVPLATRIMLGHTLTGEGYLGDANGLWPAQPLVAVKAPVFSMAKIAGAEMALGPEMKSTGEVMGVDFTYPAALRKALIAAGIYPPATGGTVLASVADRDKAEALPLLRALAGMGYQFVATGGTAAFLEEHGIPTRAVGKISDGDSTILEQIRGRAVQLVINTITGGRGPLREGIEIQDGFQIRRAAVETGIPCLTSLDTARAVAETLRGASDYAVLPLPAYRAGAAG
ncbi:MAG TPA: carbamoyl-phosphate synthase large subunit [Ktedonobacterales bacterium]|nr:carbamoyl-phosphate synthase large subunit [Ktedonobacterales bacterium]